MSSSVTITFDCLPLRSIDRLDIPLDASPLFRARCERILAAMEKHGKQNAYYLHTARCVFRLANSDDIGMFEFGFEGTVLTGDHDQKTRGVDLNVELLHETCEWLSESIVEWFKETVSKAVTVEFDRYIAAGDLKKTVERIEKLQTESDAQGGFVGMYL